MTEPIPAREHEAASGRFPFSARIEEPASAAFALLAELELSLRAGQQALLALNVAAIERCSEEQIRLSRALGIFLPPARQFVAYEQPQPAWLECSPDLRVKVLAAARRVLELTRIQAALIDRARRFLVVLSNLVAEPGDSYAPRVLLRATLPPTS